MNDDLKRDVDQLKRDLRDLQDEMYSNNFTSSQDFNKFSRFNSRLQAPRVDVLSTVCEQGEVCLLTTTGKLYVCSATDTWTIVGTQS